ncbi:MAG: methyltransferase [Thermoproteota archaeon]|nr:methyltransferase [Thermoproteota archaeon]
MYTPSEDTFFIADIISGFFGNYALEIGAGTGYLTKILCKNYRIVIATDIDFNAIKHAKSSLDGFRNKTLLCCDVSYPVRFRFDLIISNPPYLPQDKEDLFDNAIYGGITGLETTFKILNLAKSSLKDKGKIVIVKSSLTRDEEFGKFIKQNFLTAKIIAKKKLFFETLEIIEISKHIPKKEKNLFS